jgi:hypothetical protein
MKRILPWFPIVVWLLACGPALAHADAAKKCYSDTQFPQSAVEQWRDGLASLPSSGGQRWQLSLKQTKDSCGMEVESLETAIVIQGNLPDPEVATTWHVDVPIQIAVPGKDTRFFGGHQYTPERLRKDGQGLKPSYVYGGTDYRDFSAGDYQCDSEHHRRELESVQFTGMNATSAASVEVRFFKGVFAAGIQRAVKYCSVDYAGTATRVSK